MEVSVEQTEGLERRLKVALPEDRVTGEVEERVEKMARSVSIPGFRPGKVPVKVVRQRYGKAIRDEVVGELVRNSFQDALTQENLRPAGSPTIDEIQSDPGSGVAYEATFEIYPEVTVPVMESLQVIRPVSQVEDADVDSMIDTLRQQRKTWDDVERAALDNDRVVVDFTGTCEGEPITDGKAEKVSVDIGAGRMVQGFETGLIGTSAGDDLTLNVTFPDGAPDEKLAGKPAEFEVHVHNVQEPKLPDLDESFFASFGVGDGSEDGFRVEVRQNMERELEEAVRATTKRRVMDSLLEAEVLELPAGLVDEEVERISNQRRMDLVYQGIDPEQVSLDRSMFEDDARRRVGLGLLLAEIVKSNDMTADPETVRERIESIASTYDESDKVINWYYSNYERLQEIESAVLEDQVVEWILERANVSEEPSTFDALLNPRQTNPQNANA